MDGYSFLTPSLWPCPSQRADRGKQRLDENWIHSTTAKPLTTIWCTRKRVAPFPIVSSQRRTRGCVCSSRKRRGRLEFKRRSLKNAREIRTGFKQLPVERDFYFDLYFYNDEGRGGEKERRIRGGLKRATCVTATMLFSDGV